MYSALSPQHSSSCHSSFQTAVLFFCLFLLASLGSASDARVISKAADGTPSFVRGDLGTLDLAFAKSDLNGEHLRASAEIAMQSVLTDHFGATGLEGARFLRARNERGRVQIRFTQEIHGLPVAGAQLVLHADAETGRIHTVNGEFVRAAGVPLVPEVDGENALDLAQKRLNARYVGERGTPSLTYVLDRNGAARLAWQADLKYIDVDGDFQRDIVFADAVTGELAARHPQIHTGRSLQTRDYATSTSSYTIASTSSNAINTGDDAIDDAHNYAIATYDYYFNNHGRDSYNNNGATIKSRVHYDLNYNNAFWNGATLTYGDGDGTTFSPLSGDADVVAHEFTHAVISNSSGLVYQDESGALNEAWADIFGAMVDRQEGATGNDIWLIGEDIYTPGTSGDGLRDMSDPKAEGDYDYYPTRYTGSSDHGGVHWNSGIANLAFHLLVEGGTHPRGTTSINVSGIGFANAADIFYEANVGCMTSSSTFEAARTCTELAAFELYGSNTLNSVTDAWDAVGVPGGITSKTVTSKSGQDGWVLESSETSNVGGSSNSSGEGASAIRVGDDSSDRQYKSILSFSTSSIPSGATVVSAKLVMTQGEVKGSSSFVLINKCKIDIKTGGFNGSTNLEAADFEASATATNVASFSNYADTTASLNAAGIAALNRNGVTQFRLYLSQGDNDNQSRDTAGWYSGDHDLFFGTSPFRPKLIIEWID